MEWARILAYITGTVDQELLLRNGYLATENRILRVEIKGRLSLSDAEMKPLTNIGYRLDCKTFEDLANAAKPDTIPGWHRKPVIHSVDGSQALAILFRPRVALVALEAADLGGGFCSAHPRFTHQSSVEKLRLAFVHTLACAVFITATFVGVLREGMSLSPASMFPPCLDSRR